MSSSSSSPSSSPSSSSPSKPGTILKAWNFLKDYKYGSNVFAWLVLFKAPYSGLPLSNAIF